MRPFCLPRARLLSLTTRFLMLGPVLLTNWNRLFLGFPVSVSFVGGAGVRNPLSLLFALAGLVLGTLRLGLADLELFVLLVISGTERHLTRPCLFWIATSRRLDSTDEKWPYFICGSRELAPETLRDGGGLFL